MVKPRILFMGTPAFALPALELLYNEKYPVIGVVTQPDKPHGRGKKISPLPVKLFAEQNGIPVYQPDKVSDLSFREKLANLNPDMIVVAAFGQILPKEIIDYPRLGCLNIHPSLLPKYRGAAPLNWAIIRGEKVTGVTIMRMDEGMDSGDIILQRETTLRATENFGQLHDRLATEGAKLLQTAIGLTVRGQAPGKKQDAVQATFAPRLKKEDGLINWQTDIYSIANLIRGLSPAPAAYTFLDGNILKVFAAAVRPGAPDQAPGTVSKAEADGIFVATPDGYVILKEIQSAGKKRMPASDFLRGYRLPAGKILG